MGKIKEENFVLSILNKKLYGEKTSNWFEPKLPESGERYSI
jgi:hypothetical protein